jgi:hypothetical protein
VKEILPRLWSSCMRPPVNKVHGGHFSVSWNERWRWWECGANVVWMEYNTSWLGLEMRGGEGGGGGGCCAWRYGGGVSPAGWQGEFARLGL